MIPRPPGVPGRLGPGTPQHPRRGALMGIALLLLLCSGLLMAGWATVMNTRAIQTTWLDDAVVRRIALESSRELAWQAAMNHAFTPGAQLDQTTGVLPNAKYGGIDTAGGWDSLNIYAQTNSPATSTDVYPYNGTGLRPGGTFYEPEFFRRPAALDTMDDFTSHLFLKAQNPVLNGDLITVYRKPAHYPGQIDLHANTFPFTVYGRTVIRHPASLFALTTSSVRLPFLCRALYIQSHDADGNFPILGTNLDGGVMLPSNLSAQPSTSGPLTADAGPDYSGTLNVINNAANPDNSLVHIMQREEAAGRNGMRTIDAYQPDQSSSTVWTAQYNGVGSNQPIVRPPDYPSGYQTNFRTLYIKLGSSQLRNLLIINDGTVADQIVFVGQTTQGDFEAAGALPPVIVTVLNTGSTYFTKNIAFQHENNRRLILAVQDHQRLSSVSIASRPVGLQWAGSSILGREQRWRFILVNEGHLLTALLNKDSPTQDIRWLGGLMTNWSFLRAREGGVRAERLIIQSDSSMPTLPQEGGASYASLLPRDAWLETYFQPVTVQEKDL